MNRLKHICFTGILILVSCFIQSQNIDSLKQALKNPIHDTVKCDILAELAESAPDGEWEQYNEELRIFCEQKIKSGGAHLEVYKSYLATAFNNTGYIYDNLGKRTEALDYYNKSMKLQEEIGDVKGLATSLNNIGVFYNNEGNIPKALEYYNKSLAIRQEIKDKYGIAYSLINIGYVYNSQGNIPKAIMYFEQGLKIREEIGDMRGIAYALSYIGQIYHKQGDLIKALENYSRSLKIRELVGDKRGIGESLQNVGSVYENKGENSKALEFYTKAFNVNEEESNKSGIAYSLQSIGGIHEKQGDPNKALDCYLKSLKLREDIDDKKGISLVLNGIGNFYLKQGEYEKAKTYALRHMDLSKKIGYPESIRNASRQLYTIFKRYGQDKAALENFELYIQMRDSINNEETRKASVKSQLKYEYEKKMATDSVEHAKETEIKKVQIAKQETELKAKKNEQYALFGGLGLVLVFAGFMYNRYRLTQKQKKIIEQQKLLVEEKQREIVDSIHYARRIQKALITNEKYIQRNLDKLKQ